MKKLFFTALASVLFATTGFAKGGETLVNENLTLNSEILTENEQAPEVTVTCVIQVDYYDSKNQYVGTDTFHRTVEVWSESSANTACEFQKSKLMFEIKNGIVFQK